MLELYVRLVQEGRKTIEEVPVKFREAVKTRLDADK